MAALFVLVAGGAAWLWLPTGCAAVLSLALLLLYAFVLRFFRHPRREPSELDPGLLLAPADGTVVAIEPVWEGEHLEEQRIQLSIFMSIWDIHVNWFPTGGTVSYFRHHPGKHLVAWHPKSSTDNERTTTVLTTDGGERILFRQIAGILARRIVSYAIPGNRFERGQQCGFIKFGSRVDVLLPVGCEILVALDDKTVGACTPIARLTPSNP